MRPLSDFGLEASRRALKVASGGPLSNWKRKPGQRVPAPVARRNALAAQLKALELSIKQLEDKLPRDTGKVTTSGQSILTIPSKLTQEEFDKLTDEFTKLHTDNRVIILPEAEVQSEIRESVRKFHRPVPKSEAALQRAHCTNLAWDQRNLITDWDAYADDVEWLMRNKPEKLLNGRKLAVKVSLRLRPRRPVAWRSWALRELANGTAAVFLLGCALFAQGCASQGRRPTEICVGAALMGFPAFVRPKKESRPKPGPKGTP